MATLFWEVLLCGLELTQARPTCGGPGVGLGPCVWGCARNRKKNRLKLSYALVRQSPYAELRPDVGAKFSIGRLTNQSVAKLEPIFLSVPGAAPHARPKTHTGAST